MQYEDFKEAFISELSNVFKKNGHNVKISNTIVHKSNQGLDGIV